MIFPSANLKAFVLKRTHHPIPIQKDFFPLCHHIALRQRFLNWYGNESFAWSALNVCAVFAPSMCYVQTSEWSDETKSRLRTSQKFNQSDEQSSYQFSRALEGKISLKSINFPFPLSSRSSPFRKFIHHQHFTAFHCSLFASCFKRAVSVFLSTISRNYLNEQKSSCLTFSFFPQAANEKSPWNRKSDTFNAFSICSQSLNLNIEIYCAWEWNFGKPFICIRNWNFPTFSMPTCFSHIFFPVKKTFRA